MNKGVLLLAAVLIAGFWMQATAATRTIDFYIFCDTNCNAVRDSEDEVLSGVKISCQKRLSFLGWITTDSERTDENGHVRFTPHEGLRRFIIRYDNDAQTKRSLHGHVPILSIPTGLENDFQTITGNHSYDVLVASDVPRALAVIRLHWDVTGSPSLGSAPHQVRIVTGASDLGISAVLELLRNGTWVQEDAKQFDDESGIATFAIDKGRECWTYRIRLLLPSSIEATTSSKWEFTPGWLQQVHDRNFGVRPRATLVMGPDPFILDPVSNDPHPMWKVLHRADNTVETEAHIGDTIRVAFEVNDLTELPIVTILEKDATVTDDSTDGNWGWMWADYTISPDDPEGPIPFTISFVEDTEYGPVLGYVDSGAQGSGLVLVAAHLIQGPFMYRADPARLNEEWPVLDGKEIHIGDTLRINFYVPPLTEMPEVTILGSNAEVTDPTGSRWMNGGWMWATYTVLPDDPVGPVSFSIDFVEATGSHPTRGHVTAGEHASGFMLRSVFNYLRLDIYREGQGLERGVQGGVAYVGDDVVLHFHPAVTFDADPIATINGKPSEIVSESGGWYYAYHKVTDSSAAGPVEFSLTYTLDGQERTRHVTNDGSNVSIAELLMDSMPPTDPVVASPSHEIGTPSGDPDVEIDVSGAADDGSGVDGFEVAFDRSETWTPSHVKTIEEDWTGGTFTATLDGAWWFHLATCDNAGNWTGTVHLGPFAIDTSEPQLLGSTLTTGNPSAEYVSPGDFVILVFEVSDALSQPPSVALGRCAEVTASYVGANTWEATFDPLPDDCDEGVLEFEIEMENELGIDTTIETTGNPKRTLDVSPPVISDCPTDVATSADLGSCSTVVTWTEPGADDYYSGLASFVSTHAPGDTFAVGTTTVTYTARDSAGNMSMCSFDVTVSDMEDPIITCPADVTVGTDPGVCYTTGVDLGTPSASDNCSTPAVTNDAPAQFPKGDTSVTWTAIDDAGNTATCAQTITVIDTEAPQDPASFSSSSHVAGEASTDSTIDVVWSGASDNCGVVTGYSVLWDTAPGSIPDATIHVAHTSDPHTTTSPALADGDSHYVHLRTRDDAGSWTSTIHLGPFWIDTANPVIIAPANVTIECDEDCLPPNPGQATATDNTDPAPTVTYSDQHHNLLDERRIDRTWTATDAAGNVASALQQIWLDPPNVVFNSPDPSIIGSLPATVQMRVVVEKWAEAFGVYLVSDESGTQYENDPSSTPVVADGVTVNPVTIDLPAGAAEGLYDITTLCPLSTATPGCVGVFRLSGPDNCLTVDVTNPIISGCPADITVPADPGETSAVVTWTEPTADDAISGIASFVSNHSPGETLPVGTTTVTYTATDHAGHTTICSFDVTVVGASLVLTVPPDVTVECDECSDPICTGQAAATSTCDPNPTVTYSDGTYHAQPDSGALWFDRTWSATDTCGGADSGVQRIYIDPPIVTITSIVPDWRLSLPGTVTVYFTVEKCGDQAYLQIRNGGTSYQSGWALITSDGSTVNSLVTSLPSDAPEGLYQIKRILIYDVTPSGNIAHCEGAPKLVDAFGVDITDPVISGCPADIKEEVGPCETSAMITWTEPTADDAVSGIASFASPHTPGEIFPEGTTTVTYTATDNAGNTATCSFDVTVDSTNEVITFTDAGLEAAVRDAIGKPTGDITDCDVASLTVLDAGHRSIADLSGIERLTALVELELIGNDISDISLLAGLTDLEILGLNANDLTDISPLSGLSRLENLDLDNNNLSGVAPLSSLTAMKYMDLHSTGISDISALTGLTNLLVLDLKLNSIVDVSAIAGMNQLANLYLDRNDIEDISPLVSNTGLGAGDWIDLRGNPLNAEACSTHIPALESRGANVGSDCP